MSRRGHFKAVSAPKSYLPFDRWPETDRRLWAHLMRQGDVFEGGGRGSTWAPRTVQNVLQGYGAWLNWLSADDEGALKEQPLARVTRDRVKLYTEVLQKRLAPCTVQVHLQRLGQAATGFSEGREFRWIFHAANRLKPVSVRNKRARMQPSYKLAELGFRLMREANFDSPSWPSPPATQYRNGLILALLAYRPVRRGNLVGIIIGQQLVRDGDKFVLRFSDAETKQREAIEFDVPASLTPFLNHYLDTVRPKMTAKDTDGGSLWVSRDGGPMTPNGVTAVVTKLTKEEFGYPVNPHLFRDCAATTIANDDPENAGAIMGVLSHSSMVTSEKHYNQARMLEAGSEYHRVLEGRRRRRRAL